MNYEKLTVDRFALNLKEGKYAALTGARRAIGKTSSWSTKEKDKAREMAEKHFAGSGATKAAAKKVPQVKSAKKGPKAKAVKAVAAEKPKKVTQKKGKKARFAVTENKALAIDIRNPQQAIAIGLQIVQFVQSAADQLRLLKATGPTPSDTSIAETELRMLITKAAQLVHTKGLNELLSTPVQVTKPKNGAVAEISHTDEEVETSDILTKSTTGQVTDMLRPPTTQS